MALHPRYSLRMNTVTDAAAASFAALTHKLDYLDEADIRRVRDA